MKKNEFKHQWIGEYEKEYRRQSKPYEQWITKWESGIPVRGIEDACFAVQPWEAVFPTRRDMAFAKTLLQFLQGLSENVKYVVLTGAEGRLSKQAKYRLSEYFEAHPEVQAVYGDEDEWNEEKQERQNPWFKPDWSPDTLHSFLYTGNIMAVRVSLLREASVRLEQSGDTRRLSDHRMGGCSEDASGGPEEGDSVYQPFWGFLLYLADDMGISFGHIDCILFHKTVSQRRKGPQQSEQGREEQPGDHKKKETVSGQPKDHKEKEPVAEQPGDEMETENVVHVRYPAAGKGKTVSVIIPSKDHPKLLRQCLKAIAEATAYPSYEVIVVDNGSAPENRNLIQDMQEQGDNHFSYLYQEMEFNFSEMCNLGAAHAKGDVLLFLNDDIEVQGKEWMTILAEQALQPHTGAVGAKLYYPGSGIIQHAGITNMKIGPAHKLGGMEDRGSLYHGRNLADHNVLAVTAACLAVERKKYDEAGGFCEELAVAYNDVDFCFSLYEKGYYNLVRNDVVLFHHESYSRGSDRDEAKEKRLLEERKRLYQRHPQLYGRDPFYSRHLVQERLDADYHVELQYEYERGDTFSRRQPAERFEETKNSLFRRLARKGAWNRYHLDEVRIRQTDVFDEKSRVLELEGWCALTDRDMAEYKRELMLMGQDGMTERLEIFDKLRPDAAHTLPEQAHGALCGFVARLRPQELQDGEYQVGYLYWPRAGGMPLVQYGERLILKSTAGPQTKTASVVRDEG